MGEEPVPAPPTSIELIEARQRPDLWSACCETFGKEVLADFALYTPLEISAEQREVSPSMQRLARFRRAAVSKILAGLLMAVLYVPFTIAHGPTSINRGDEVLGADMRVWGFLLGVVPCTVLGLALWRLRDAAAGARAVTRKAWTAVAVLLLLSAAQDLAFRALGPPTSYFVMAPALLIIAATHRSRGRGDPAVRIVTGVLSLLLLAGLVNMVFLQETADGFGNYRMSAFLLYGAGGLGWAGLGVAINRVSLDDGLAP